MQENAVKATQGNDCPVIVMWNLRAHQIRTGAAEMRFFRWVMGYTVLGQRHSEVHRMWSASAVLKKSEENLKCAACVKLVSSRTHVGEITC
jgi:hypothetical protein